MIGGYDYHISTTRGSEALDFAIRAIRVLWPAVILENGETGEVLCYENISFSTCREILAYQNPEYKSLWDALGADTATKNTMIYCLIDDDMLTLVVDGDPSPQIKAFLESVKEGIGKLI